MPFTHMTRTGGSFHRFAAEIAARTGSRNRADVVWLRSRPLQTLMQQAGD